VLSFAIIPAAGRSRRMGQPKLLLPWGTSTVIEQVLAAWRQSRVTHTIVVVHPNDETLAEVCRRCGAIVVQPDQPPPEMKDSILHGLARAAEFEPQPQDAWLVAPADLPTLQPDWINAVLAMYEGLRSAHEAPRIWLPCSDGHRGHPLLLAWAFAGEVASLSAHEGLNALLDRHRLGYVDFVDAATAEDLDTPEDYQRLRPPSTRSRGG